MPGVLKEALMVREAAQMPTWIVEEPSSIFGPGHFAYSEDTAMYIERLFTIVNLVDESRTPDEPRGIEASEPVEDVGMEAPTPQVVRTSKPRFDAPKIDVDELLGAAEEGTSYKKKSSSWKRKGGGGGGPV
jgi:hypothetical protein